MPISMGLHSGYNKAWAITSKTMQHTLQCSKSTELRKGAWHPPGHCVSALVSVQISLKDWLCKVQECVWPETHRGLQKTGNSENKWWDLCQRQPPASPPCGRSAVLPSCRAETACFLANSCELWVMCWNCLFYSGSSKAFSISSQVQKGQQ